MGPGVKNLTEITILVEICGESAEKHHMSIIVNIHF